MGRPKGSPNKPGYQKPGRKPHSTEIPAHFTDKQIIAYKEQILELLESELVNNLAEAADLLGIPKIRVYQWSSVDKEWASLVHVADKIRVARLEADLDRMNNPVARIFRLKKLDPSYRDTYRVQLQDPQVEKLLQELRNLGKSTQPEVVEEKEEQPLFPLPEERMSPLTLSLPDLTKSCNEAES